MPQVFDVLKAADVATQGQQSAPELLAPETPYWQPSTDANRPLGRSAWIGPPLL